MKEWTFYPEKQIYETVNWIKDYFVKNGNPNTKAVIGISGGKDSTIAAALLVRALGPDRVIGVLMPNGTQSDIVDSYRVCEILGIRYYVFNIGDAYNKMIDAFNSDITLPINNQIITNTPSRLRMTALYMVAAAVNGRVCNTGNASEAWIGYTTKYGDLAGDFALLRRLTVREVLMVGRLLEEIPSYLIEKAPADGMSGKTDEDNMGITYEQIDSYLLDDELPDMKTYELMQSKHKNNSHKNCVHLPCPYNVGRYTEGDIRF